MNHPTTADKGEQECREAFNKWLSDHYVYFGDEITSEEHRLMFNAWQAAWNRPTEQAPVEVLDELAQQAQDLGFYVDPQAGGGLTEAITAAELVRMSLADKYQDNLKTNSADMDGNMDWARLEGAVKVVQALRALNQRLAVEEEQ